MKTLNKKGFTLLELIVGLSVTAIAGFGVAGISMMVSESSARISERSAFLNFKARLMSMIENPEAWAQTVNQNTGAANSGDLTCLVPDAAGNMPDCAGETGAINVYDSVGNLFYDSANPEAGFNSNGEVCNTFVSNPQICPFRYNVSWIPSCPAAGACQNPLVSILGQIQFSAAAQNTALLAEPNFTILRSFAKNTLERQCRVLGGVFNPEDRECGRGTDIQMCPTGQVVSSIAPDGRISCSVASSATCPSGTVLVGFNLSNPDPDSEDLNSTPICRSLQEQFPNRFPSSATYQIPCSVFGKVNDDLWWSKAGEVQKPVVCENDSTKKVFNVFARSAEYKCIADLVWPTGRVEDTPLNITIGSCEAETCPTGQANYSPFWITQEVRTERFQCYGSDDSSLERNATYTVKTQMLCVNNQMSTTGVQIKNEVSREACPGLSQISSSNLGQLTAPVSPKPSKILIVVDNSLSMKNHMDRLRANLDSLLNENDFGKQNLKVQVLDSASPGTDANVQKSPRNDKFFSVSRKDFIFSNNVYTEVSRSVYDSWPTIKRIVQRATLRNGNRFSFNKGSTNFNDFKKQVSDSILALGTNGPDLSSGKCNALVTLNESSSTRFFEPGDVGGIIFLSDDRDLTEFNGWPNGCSDYYQYDFRSETLTVERPVYEIERLVYAMTAQFDSTGDGGVPRPVETTQKELLGGITQTSPLNAGDNCPADIVAQLVTRIQNDYDSKGSTTFIRKNVVVRPETIVCKVEFVANRNYDKVPAAYDSINVCTEPFTAADGVTYANLLAMSPDFRGIAGANKLTSFCRKRTPPSTRIRDDSRLRAIRNSTDPEATGYKSLDKAIVNQGRALMPDGFFITTITDLPSNPCPLRPGVTRKTDNWLGLTSLLGSKGKNASICSSSYAGALSELAESISIAAVSSFTVTLKSNQSIDKVMVIRNGQNIFLEPSQYSVTENGGPNNLTLKIDPANFTIQAGDEVAVTLRTRII